MTWFSRLIAGLPSSLASSLLLGQSTDITKEYETVELQMSVEDRLAVGQAGSEVTKLEGNHCRSSPFSVARELQLWSLLSKCDIKLQAFHRLETAFVVTGSRHSVFGDSADLCRHKMCGHPREASWWVQTLHIIRFTFAAGAAVCQAGSLLVRGLADFI